MVLSIRRFKDGISPRGHLLDGGVLHALPRPHVLAPPPQRAPHPLDEKGRVLVDRALAAVSSLVLVLTLYTLSISYGSLLSRPIPYGVGVWATSPVYLLNLGDVPLFMLFTILSRVVGSYLVGPGEYQSATIVFLIWVYVFLVFNWRIWHSLFPAPCHHAG